jgi:hypothetical protein
MNAEPVRGNASRVRLAPDTRRGWIRVVRSMEGTVQFQWVNRQSNDVALDLTVFPGDVTFRRVKAEPEKPNERVYELKYTSGGNRNFFFWMQEAKPEVDAENVTKLLRAINEPDAAAAEVAGGQQPGRAGAGRRAGAARQGAGGLDPALLAQFLDSFNTANAPAASTAPAPAPASAAAPAPSPAPAPAAAPSPAPAAAPAAAE